LELIVLIQVRSFKQEREKSLEESMRHYPKPLYIELFGDDFEDT
jgi:hypothetical protein